MKRIRKKELTKLMNHIEDDYDGNYAELSRHLQKIAYCLHFVSENDFPRSDLQVLSFTVYELGECFYEAHQVRKRHEYEQARKRFAQFPHPSELLR